jgi:hypothetical protein
VVTFLICDGINPFILSSASSILYLFSFLLFKIVYVDSGWLLYESTKFSISYALIGSTFFLLVLYCGLFSPLLDKTIFLKGNDFGLSDI